MIRSLATRLATASLLAVVSTGAMAPTALAQTKLAQTQPAQAPATGANAPTPEFTKEHLAAAQAAIAAAKVNEGFDNVLIDVALRTKQNLVRTNPSLSNQIEEVVNKVALELAARRPELDRQVQEIWAVRFSKAELDDIAKFYNSPVGQKLNKETPGIVRFTTAAVGVWQNAISQEMINRVREEMTKRGHKL